MRDGGREDWREGQTDPFPAAEIRRLETGTGLGRNDFAVQTTCHRQSDLPGPRQGVDPEGVLEAELLRALLITFTISYDTPANTADIASAIIKDHFP